MIMKKIIYCFVAALALIACTPKNGADQIVRIGVSLDDNAQPNQKGQQRITAIDNGGTVIEVKWKEGDVLYYQLDGKGIDKTNPFKLISGAETKNAIFECEAPGDLISNSFTLYYSGAGTPGAEINKTQISSANTIDNKYLFYTASDCKIGKAIKLSPDFTLLGVQLITTPEESLIPEGYISIGTNLEDIGDNSIYSCKIQGKDLKTAPIYYVVFPKNYVLTGKQIGITNGPGHPFCNLLILPEIVSTPNNVQIITIKVTKGNDDAVHTKYEITKG